jgi:hypothetical protein
MSHSISIAQYEAMRDGIKSQSPGFVPVAWFWMACPELPTWIANPDC